MPWRRMATHSIFLPMVWGCAKSWARLIDFNAHSRIIHWYRECPQGEVSGARVAREEFPRKKYLGVDSEKFGRRKKGPS